MSGERPALTSSANPRPMEKTHLAVEDIFGGDENKHRIADEVLRQDFEWLFDMAVGKLHDMKDSELAGLIKIVVLNLPEIYAPENDVIAFAPDIRDFVKECVRNKDYKSIRNLAFLRKDAVAEATMQAWSQPYMGDALKCFLTVVCHYRELLTLYGRVLPIVQSSGTGKSRLVDELSKEHLVVPINLRPQDESGFPAADHDVRDFLNKGYSPLEVYIRYTAFFTALFQRLLIHVQYIEHAFGKFKDNVAAKDCNSIAAKFRFLMTHNQTYTSTNDYRKMFYQQVCKQAEFLLDLQMQPRDESAQQKDTNICDAARDLIHFLNPESKNHYKRDGLPPVIILAFDEAHRLTEPVVQTLDTEKPWSRFDELRRNIRRLKSFPILSLFISTVSIMSDVMPEPRQDPSMRVVNDSILSLLPPFTEVGFDQLRGMSPIAEDTVNIQDAATDEFMCQFGRPLFGTLVKYGNWRVLAEIVRFAASKLICGSQFEDIRYIQLDDDQKLACMAVRLSLEFKPTTLQSKQRERLQIAKHMRICITVTDHHETVFSVASSEPILAEAARRIMSLPGFNLPESLLHELQTPGLNKGNGGELICLVLLLLASDKAATAGDGRVFGVLDFFRNLLNNDDYAKLLEAKPSRRRNMESDGETTFQETFTKSKIYFSHFVKIHESGVMNRSYLWMLIARGAAILCADNQRGIDILVPFTYHDDMLGRRNVSAILIQVKNGPRFSTTPIRWLFDGMNPYFVGVFHHDEEPLPVIRMVFALASTKSGVTIMEPEGTRYRKKGQGNTTKKSLPYISYDIWCAGAFAKTFAVINETEEKTYEQLLEASSPFPKSSSTLPGLKARNRPMSFRGMITADHWRGFKPADGKTEETDEYEYDVESEEEDDDIEML